MRCSKTSILALAVATFAASACGTDRSPGVTGTALKPHTAAYGLLPSPVTVYALRRTPGLSADITVSAVVGSAGYTFTIPDAGLTVIIPKSALSSPVAISVTALAGSVVAYEFSPHGLMFKGPVTVIQDLNNTSAPNSGVDPSKYQVGYLQSATTIDQVASTASVIELLPIRFDANTYVEQTFINHFSGYIWATGRDDQ